MMKIIHQIKWSAFVLITGIAAIACDSFLDQQPLNQPTSTQDIFVSKLYTERYLNSCYGYIPDYWLLSAANGTPWSAASDESIATWDHAVNQMNNGSWNPNNVSYGKWREMYQGIREMNIFLQNVDICEELSVEDRTRYKAEVRFLRAYIYHELIRMYGPVILVYDEVYDLDREYSVGRNTFEDCVSYVCEEFTEASKILTQTQTSDSQFGRPTRGAALAMKARLLNFAASPLFNTGNSIYANWMSKTTDENLMPVAYSEQKWRDAAAAAKEVIDMNLYELYAVYADGNLDPYASIYGIHYVKWNSELIFGRHMTFGSTQAEARNFVYRITPKVFNNCWGGVSISQRQVDAFAMNDGRYPITGYSDGSQAWDGKDGRNPVIDPLSGYSETGATNFYHPWDKVSISTYNMYVNREPRFYMSIVYDNLQWMYGANFTKSVVIDYGKDGSSYEAAGTNHPLTGYTPRKFTFRETDPSLGNSGFVFSLWPIIRLAEIYLDYVEALIEYDHQNPDVFKYWNMIRTRAGVPDIEAVYPEIVDNRSLMREMVRRERQVELFFENSRYFDIRRWKIAEATNHDAPVYGMNISEDDGADNSIGQTDYWQRTPTSRGKRTFLPKHYLYPLAQRELDRNKGIEQSWGW